MAAASKTPPKDSSAKRAYDTLRRMAMTFHIRPDTRLNEAELADKLSISRTPLREALNRLVAEGLLVSRGRGFSGRKLVPETVAQLYEARAEIEAAIVRLASERASADDLAEIEKYISDSAAESEDIDVDRLVQLDVGFHDRLALMSGNQELLRILGNLNDRIHFIRWINMEGRRSLTQSEHFELVGHIKAGDGEAAAQLIKKHVLLRNDQILEALKKAYAHIYTAEMSQSWKEDA